MPQSKCLVSKPKSLVSKPLSKPKSLAQAILCALSDQATSDYASCSFLSKPPLYDTSRLATHVRDLFHKDKKREAIAFLQGRLDNLTLDTCCSHLGDQVLKRWRWKGLSDTMLDDARLRDVIAVHTVLTVSSLVLDPKGTVLVTFSMTISFVDPCVKDTSTSTATMGHGWSISV